MVNPPLFPKDRAVGIFRGFCEGGLEFRADIILPYRNDYHTIAMHGQFLLVQLASEDEAVLGRITSFYSDGKLTSSIGEDFSIRAMAEDREVPEDLREQYVKYRVNIRVLGLLRSTNGSVVFVPSQRRLPHVGSKVAFPCDNILREIAGHNVVGADLGFFALGEFVYAAGEDRLSGEDWMQVISPAVVVRFPIRNLVSRRSFVFARAGFGKSNLVKLLFSELYRETPVIEKRGKEVPVGTLIFDPEGEYFWPDDKNNPGLADVPHLEDKLVVFTRRQAPSSFYGSFVAGKVKLDIRPLPPSSVIGIALSPERQEQQNVRKLKGLSPDKWKALVDLIYKYGHSANIGEINKLIGIDEGQSASVEATAARSNMTFIVQTLHDPHSRLMDSIFDCLKAGKLIVVDISQMRGEQGFVLSGLILQQLFEHNQEKFTEREPQTIPTIAVVEEAQSVLGQGSGSGEGPYVSWFKEGRKYDLGAVMITQQPGSIPVELLSQGDNWFIFHLLSASDLKNLQRANAHFSDDLLGALLNEPIPGQGVLWSSVAGKPYPIPFRGLSFSEMYKRRDVDYSLTASQTFAASLIANRRNGRTNQTPLGVSGPTEGDEEEPDWYTESLDAAVMALKQNAEFQESMLSRGEIPWIVMMRVVEGQLPGSRSNRKLINSCIARALNETLGHDNWDTEKRTSSKGNDVTWAYRKEA